MNTADRCALMLYQQQGMTVEITDREALARIVRLADEATLAGERLEAELSRVCGPSPAAFAATLLYFSQTGNAYHRTVRDTIRHAFLQRAKKAKEDAKQ